MEGIGEVIGDLSPHGDDDSLRMFEIGDVAHALKRQFLEIEAVRFIEVGRDRFGIGIDQNHFGFVPPQGARHVDGAPVELDRGADAIGAGADDDRRFLFRRGDVVGAGLIGGVEIIGLGVKFSREGVDLLDEGGDLVLDPQLPDFLFSRFFDPGDRLIGKSELFGSP